MIVDTVANSGNDEWYTPAYAILPLLKYIKPKSRILCPFDTEESLYVNVFRKAGHNVIHTHIREGKDFFKLRKANVDYIISNPPYSKKTEVLEKCFELKIPFAMLIGAVGIFESRKRFEMFRNNKFEMMCFDKRISYLRSYDEKKPTGDPPFSSSYICSNVLPKQIVFEAIDKTKIRV